MLRRRGSESSARENLINLPHGCPLPIELKQKFAIFATCRISNLQMVLDSSQYFGNSNL